MTTTDSLARRLASHGERLYYTARPWQGEFRIRVYTVIRGQVTGLDQLLTADELQDLGLERTPFSASRTGGPGGLVLSEGHRRYHTCYAAARAVGRHVGLDVEPTDGREIKVGDTVFIRVGGEYPEPGRWRVSQLVVESVGRRYVKMRRIKGRRSGSRRLPSQVFHNRAKAAKGRPDRFYVEADGQPLTWYVVDKYADPLGSERRLDCVDEEAARDLAREYNESPPYPPWDTVQAERDGYWKWEE